MREVVGGVPTELHITTRQLREGDIPASEKLSDVRCVNDESTGAGDGEIVVGDSTSREAGEGKRFTLR